MGVGHMSTWAYEFLPKFAALLVAVQLAIANHRSCKLVNNYGFWKRPLGLFDVACKVA